ncbi:hypothetical protein F5141DRAFT_1060030 [Pisolithus sp. B1]|nr:hypothetical protein F5141DRAFT_1060030 [Pisolithus sp. B1]
MACTATLHGKHVCPKLSNDQQQECHARQVNLASDIPGSWQAYTQEVRDIAQNHGWYMHLNPFSGLIPSSSSRVTTSVTTGCDQGDHVKLMQFMARNKADLLATYKNLTPVQQEAYNAKVQVARDTKVVVMCSNPKAVSHTISTAFANMDWETALCAQTGLEGFYIAV